MSALISLSDAADIMPFFSNCYEALPCGQGSQHRQWEGFLLSAWPLNNYLCLIHCSTIIWADRHKSVQCSINLGNISCCNQMSYFWSSQFGLILRPLAPAFSMSPVISVHRERLSLLWAPQKRANVFIWKALATIFSLNKCPSTSQAMPVICSLLPTLLRV